ncbi:MAG: shikimate kinase [Cyclobacteriaceae bacterium]|nr:shikimate kinase [Cyclobacteriaceae bacterium]
MPRLFIIGMPGSGKSTIGRLLAHKMGLPFFDLDEVIVEQEGASVSSIFSAKGEGYFRQVESECLKKVTSQNEIFVMATGGGSPCFHDGIDWMNSHGKTIFIDVATDTLIKRTAQQEERPLLKTNPTERIHKLYQERLSTYQKANVQAQADQLNPEEIVELLIKAVNT